MQRCTSFLFLSLILCATLSETLGLVFSAREKRGWTLNSAGYLLGPHAVDNHRSFNDKHGFTGKREIQPDEDIKAGCQRVIYPHCNQSKRYLLEYYCIQHCTDGGGQSPSPRALTGYFKSTLHNANVANTKAVHK
uniref:Galanin and GMAP prepropeptide n=1 Tax=Aquila chrysaetos chrysaetos TaxID=223781 RepID=A0A663EQN6_AQUCH